MPKKKLEKKAKKSTKSIKAKGLGDTVEQVLEATGISKIAKWVLGEDCGCECLTEDEYQYLDEYFTEAKSSVTIQTQKKMLKIYNRVFHQKLQLTSCASCFKNTLQHKLKRIYKEYNK